MVVISSPEKFLKVLGRIDRIEDPNQKYSILTTALPQLKQIKDRLLASPDQKSKMEAALLKTNLTYASLQAERTEQANLRSIGIATLGGTLCLAGLAVKDGNWSKWNPLTYLISFCAQSVFNPALRLASMGISHPQCKEFLLENSPIVSITALMAGLAIREGNWSASSPYTYLFAFAWTAASEMIAQELVSACRRN